jgi:DNA-binding CsgD family transcriptional regulator
VASSLSRGSDNHYITSQACASGIRVERRRIESTAGPRGAGAEIQRARQVADQLIARARDLAARFPTNGFALLPEPAAWLQTAEGECAAVWGQDTAEIWADLAATGERFGQPHPVAVAHSGKPTHCFATTATEAGHGIARTRHWTSRSASAPAPLKAEILQLAQRARLDLELTPPHQPEPAAGFEITAREAEVLALLATGRTNREIGRALFISEKTASVHVSHLLRKLNVTSRVEAAAIAQRMHLTNDATKHPPEKSAQ